MRTSVTRTPKSRLTALSRLLSALAILAAVGVTASGPALADDDDQGGHGNHRGWQERDYHEHERRQDEWRQHHPYVYTAPDYYYSPPPAVYVAPPVPPSINFIFPIR
jgi:hypothetical protein